MYGKLVLACAAALSFSAQVFLFAPDRLSFLPVLSQSLAIILLFTASIILYIVFIWNHSNQRSLDWIFPAIQVCVILGAYWQSRTIGGNTTGALLVTSLITILTSYALYLATIRGSKPVSQPSGSDKEDLGWIDQPASHNQVLEEKVLALTQKLDAEKHRTSQLTLLNELSQQLEAELDPPVSAQLAVNMLERAMESTVVALFLYLPEEQEYIVLASAGKMTSFLPPGYRQASGTGLLGRTTRTRKTNLINDTRLDPDVYLLQDETTLSIISIPILLHGHVKGVLEICSEKLFAFSSNDILVAEGVASELMRAWERASYHQRLTELIQAGISLTTLMDPQASVHEIAAIARNTLEAQFVFVTLLDQQGNFSRTSFAGEAVKLAASLNINPADEPLMQAALNATKPFRVRDLRKYAQAGKLEIDHASLRSLLAVPIRLHRLSIGAILAFGKREGIFFSENDESLAGLLSSQAAASIESSWLYQELRNTLSITSMLYQLSVDVIQTEELSKAAELIALAAHKVTSARETGIVLLTRDGRTEAEVEIDANGLHNRRAHPMETIEQVIITCQSIIVSMENGSLVCYPLLTRGRTYGVLWMKIPESRGQNFANMQTLANQAAIALERSVLLLESRHHTKEIEAAYTELEITYDRTLTALMSALDARDRETEGHSIRVSQLAHMLGDEMGLNRYQLKALVRGALLHDIGKIGVSDTILHKPGKLTDTEWQDMRDHPDIGARIVEGIPFIQDTLPVIRFHHERWDGSGYPLGLKGNDIPVEARIFAVADVFDALTSSRTYRKKSSPSEALRYLIEKSNTLFDPAIVQALIRLPYHDFIQTEKTSV